VIVFIENGYDFFPTPKHLDNAPLRLL